MVTPQAAGLALSADSAAAPTILTAALEGLSWDALGPALLGSAIVVALGGVAYRLVRILTRRLERDIQAGDPLVKRMREQRARTLASLLNSVALVAIVTLSALTILGMFIDIGPLLAGVGVFGLAVSFGAQSLVKDVINGIFILVEGQFGIGDVIRVGDTAGMVERITLRTIALRDLEGVVHIIPNGEITRVSNMTKAWSRAMVDVRVAYREDLDRVLAILRDLGRQLRDDPEWSQVLIEEPEVLGVHAFADSALIIRMIAKTLPLKQWDVARELRRRIKNRFDAEGIEIPYPHLRFYWGEGQNALATTPLEPTTPNDGNRGPAPRA